LDRLVKGLAPEKSAPWAMKKPAGHAVASGGLFHLPMQDRWAWEPPLM
jgi:hypothetical protein